MPWSRKDIIVTALLLGLTGILVYRISPYFRVFHVEAGDRAPDFSLTADDGSGLGLSDYEGKWVLLNFWATYCQPCVAEMPALNKLHEELKQDGLVVLGISIDEDREAGFSTAWALSFPPRGIPNETSAADTAPI